MNFVFNFPYTPTNSWKFRIVDLFDSGPQRYLYFHLQSVCFHYTSSFYFYFEISGDGCIRTQDLLNIMLVTYPPWTLGRGFIMVKHSLNMAVFSFLSPCSLIKVYQRFGGTYCLHHQGSKPKLVVGVNKRPLPKFIFK